MRLANCLRVAAGKGHWLIKGGPKEIADQMEHWFNSGAADGFNLLGLSYLTLARDSGLAVREEPYSIEQWKADAESGRLTEAFACGTAAVVTSIGRVKGADGEFTIGGQSTGPLTLRLRSALVDIQRGNAPDPYGWVERVV